MITADGKYLQLMLLFNQYLFIANDQIEKTTILTKANAFTINALIFTIEMENLLTKHKLIIQLILVNTFLQNKIPKIMCINNT